MRKERKRTIAKVLILAIALTVGNHVTPMQPSKAANDYGLSNPRVEWVTRDTIEFGSYWQEDTNGDGVANQEDEKTPIKWQILEEKDGELFLLADRVLDCKKYHETTEVVTWETSDIRGWLNGEFYSEAFSDTEQTAIQDTTVVNEDNLEYGTEGE